jgi:ubiquinone/menaquinone biosynthesis C-methylase UbiE
MSRLSLVESIMQAPDTDEEEIRRRVRADWDGSAAHWAQRQRQVGESASPVTDELIARARIKPAHRVLDLACGVGGPTFRIAERVGPEGSVLGLDFSEKMIDGARDVCRQYGVTNVEFRLIPNETELGVEAESFDVVTCRFGLMFMPDPVRCLRALRKVLRPGGRAAVATWTSPSERAPAFGLVRSIASRYIQLPQPQPGVPGIFAIPTPESLISAFDQAGFEYTEVVPVLTALWPAPNAEAWWDEVLAGCGPLARGLADLPQDKQQSVRDDALATIRAQYPSGPVNVVAEALVGSAARPL